VPEMSHARRLLHASDGFDFRNAVGNDQAAGVLLVGNDQTASIGSDVEGFGLRVRIGRHQLDYNNRHGESRSAE